MTDFQKKVYRKLKTVPVGKVVTYGQLARMVGRPKAARAIGWCMRVNPDAPRTPCHRVVSSTGDLNGYSAPGGIDKKRQLLLDEGVEFIGSRVDLSQSQYEITD